MSARLPFAALLLCAVMTAVAPTAADATQRRVPQGFYGAMLDGPAANAPAGVQDRQFALMARSGVESVRVVFSWADAQSNAGQRPDFSHLDGLVAAASAHGIALLPVVIYAPPWARLYPSRDASPPAHSSDYAAFLQSLVGRYGPSGSLWSERPRLPKRPLRTWQVWNEPHLRYQWDAASDEKGAYPGGYVQLLRAARPTLRQADSRARVVLAGLTNDSWTQLRRLYRAGARRHFDVAAAQTYTGDPRGIARVLARVREVMAAYRDRATQVWITELGWPAARGRTPVPSYHHSIVTTDGGMARRLSAGYSLAVARRHAYRIGRVYWYTWATNYRRGSIFNYAGLGSFENGAFRGRPAFRAYVRSARRYEGCVKSSSGRCR